MSVFSGLPQLASAALVLEIAVSLMKDRRSMQINAQCQVPSPKPKPTPDALLE
jgi:hypothetical protein